MGRSGGGRFRTTLDSTPARHQSMPHDSTYLAVSDEVVVMDTKTEEVPLTPSWRTLFYDFTQATTFHGVRYLTETTPYLLRRLLWILIVGGVTSGFIYIMYHRVDKYYNYDYDVNVDVVYETRAAFPGVTICNQNFARKTVAYDLGMYDSVSAYYSNNEDLIDVDDDGNLCHRYNTSLHKLIDHSASESDPWKFRNVSLDACRRLCSRLDAFNCAGFNYYGNGSCELAGGPATWNELTSGYGTSTSRQPVLERIAAMFKFVDDPEGSSFLKVIDCSPLEGYATVAHGTVILEEQRPVFEHSEWLNMYQNFTELVAHHAEDMIHRCHWEGQECDASWFDSELTDYGYCHTFTNRREFSHTNFTGSSLGLRLTINVQQNEYMPGPNSDAGIKVFLHEYGEVPMVRDLGFAVPPGRHSLIGVKMSNLTNIGPPWGTCGVQPMVYFDEYTWFRCQRDCEIRSMNESCGCRAPYMHTNNTDPPPFCNMTHYITCSKSMLNNLSSNHPSSASDCSCIEPCQRTIYEPIISNAALSQYSIEAILNTNTETILANRMLARDLSYRVRESRFYATAESLVMTRLAFDHFLEQAKIKTATFQTDLILPVINTLTSFLQVFENDMNKILYLGVNRAMAEIDIVYGPSRDSIYHFIERVIRNAKLISLHVRNYLADGYLYPGLDELTQDSIVYAEVVTESLPRYYSMVIDVASTIESLDYNMSSFVFPPERLARSSDKCERSVAQLVEHTGELKHELSALYQGIEQVISTDTRNETLQVSFKGILKDLYESIGKYVLNYDDLKEDCLDPFIILFEEITLFNESYKEEVTVHLDLEYTFEFEEESEEVEGDVEFLQKLMDQYLVDAVITKSELQDNLTEELLNEMISRERDFITKVKFRLIERLRRRMDKARTDFTDWYQILLQNAGNISEYMQINFMEQRAADMAIWRNPLAVVVPDGTVTDPALLINWTGRYNTTNWNLATYFDVNITQEAVDNLVEDFFEPITAEIDEYDYSLSTMEQSLSSSLKTIRDLMKKNRDKDEVNNGFILRNFLQMDIFYSELRTQRIIQRISYGVEDLWGDVGGYMGLLLGASVVTIFELLDVIVFNSFRKAADRHRGKTKTSTTVVVSPTQNDKHMDNEMYTNTTPYS